MDSDASRAHHRAAPGRRRRHLARYREIAGILVRHGFRHLVARMGLKGLGPTRGTLGSPAPPSEWPERLPIVLTELGSTFIKLGQVASTRTDLFPPRVVSALEQLQDQVPAIPFAEVTAELAAAWDAPPQSVLWMDPEPMASASLAQVHAGRLPDGRAVVVKIRRPGLVETAEVDLEIVSDLAARAERRIPKARQYGIKGLVAELVHAFQQELDFTVEARNTDRAGRLAAENPAVRIPEVVWELTRPNVLVMSRLEGMKVTSRAALEAAGLNPRALAQKVVHALYRQIFIDGFFHADPHPGNVHVDPDGRIIFLDWGMVGELPLAMRQRSMDLLLGMVRGRSELVVRALLRLGAVDQAVDQRELIHDVDRLRRQYYERELSTFALGQALNDLLVLAAQHRIRIPYEYALLAKTAMTLDGLVRRLDPHASLLNFGKPLVGQLLQARWSLRALEPQLEDNVLEWLHVFEALPHSLERLLDQIDRGEVRVHLEQANIDRILSHWEKLVNRVGVALVLSALVVGSALTVPHAAWLYLVRRPATGYVLGAAALLGGWRLLQAARRGHL